MEGKCLRWASFLSNPQNTCTIPRVADVTGSEKSPPGGDTLQWKRDLCSTPATIHACHTSYIQFRHGGQIHLYLKTVFKVFAFDV